MEEIKTHKCIKCGEEKPLTSEYFYKRNTKFGFNKQCKNCMNKKSVEWGRNNPEKKRKSANKYARSEKNKIRLKKIYEENPVLCNICEKPIPYELSFGGRICSDECRDKRRIQENKYKSDWNKRKLKEDPLYALKVAYRRNVWVNVDKYLHTNKTELGISTQDLLGCDWKTLRNHLESQFDDRMNWNNQEQFGWHIDHIKPLCSAKSEEELIKLFHYKNLQPLWWDENLSKGGTY